MCQLYNTTFRNNSNLFKCNTWTYVCSFWGQSHHRNTILCSVHISHQQCYVGSEHIFQSQRHSFGDHSSRCFHYTHKVCRILQLSLDFPSSQYHTYQVKLVTLQAILFWNLILLEHSFQNRKQKYLVCHYHKHHSSPGWY